jgi:tetratricopeptide (TPR) repeat protein
MNDNTRSLTKQRVAIDPAPNPLFMKKFEEVIGSWAEATSAGKAEDAQAAAMRAMIMAAEEALRNPTPEILLKNEADHLESKGAWAEAEALRRKILDLVEPSENMEESWRHFARIANGQMALSSLLRLLGRDDEAWQFACAATVSARRAKIVPLLVTALMGEAGRALDRGDTEKALAAASEALQVVKPGKLFDHERARALTTRARCLLAHGDPKGAELDLASARDLLPENSGSGMLLGIIWTVANWWEVKSRLEERLGNPFYAREAITTAIEHYRQCIGPHALMALARALESLGAISQADGDEARATQSLSEAASIREGLHLPAAT